MILTKNFNLSALCCHMTAMAHGNESPLSTEMVRKCLWYVDSYFNENFS